MKKNLGVLFSVFLLLGGGVKAVNVKAESANESVGVYERIEKSVMVGTQNADANLQIHAKSAYLMDFDSKTPVFASNASSVMRTEKFLSLPSLTILKISIS